MAALEDPHTAGGPPRGRGPHGGFGLGVLGDAVAVDEERDEVDERVGDERHRPQGGEQEAAEDEADEAGERRRLEPRDGAATKELVGGGGERDEAEDRGTQAAVEAPRAGG